MEITNNHSTKKMNNTQMIKGNWQDDVGNFQHLY